MEDWSRKNSVYAEVFGNATFYSMNYERYSINEKDLIAPYIRVGFGDTFDTISYFPFEVGLVFGWKDCFEFGGGWTLLRSKGSSLLNHKKHNINVILRVSCLIG